ncbi:MAG: alpha/beta hydrolase [Proteobacteria bacterium]|nr:alpha/beta hydrolase [Desulfobacula sp.]MBU3953199.1 alpha/beta hydrolase [Pseudomonadota bacterium]MBU4131207.1 alpha/beta hydrolase [Pseudomonadota bacterium]
MTSPENECVILLHGLARTRNSMGAMEKALSREGYRVVNMEYPSRKFGIEKLANDTISKALIQCQAFFPKRIHFVTHSLGGILVRQYLSINQIENLGRVVMLSPPNKGSQVVDKIGQLPGFYWLNGPAGLQLGTDGIPSKLGAVHFELGVITGNKSINFILSLLIPGEDDGKVSIDNAKVDGMSDFLVLPHSHPFIMKSEDVIHQTKYFLQHGYFEK